MEREIVREMVRAKCKKEGVSFYETEYKDEECEECQKYGDICCDRTPGTQCNNHDFILIFPAPILRCAECGFFKEGYGGCTCKQTILPCVSHEDEEHETYDFGGDLENFLKKITGGHMIAVTNRNERSDVSEKNIQD